MVVQLHPSSCSSDPETGYCSSSNPMLKAWKLLGNHYYSVHTGGCRRSYVASFIWGDMTHTLETMVKKCGYHQSSIGWNNEFNAVYRSRHDSKTVVTKAHQTMCDRSQKHEPGAHCTAFRQLNMLHRVHSRSTSWSKALPGCPTSFCFFYVRCGGGLASFGQLGLSESLLCNLVCLKGEP